MSKRRVNFWLGVFGGWGGWITSYTLETMVINTFGGRGTFHPPLKKPGGEKPGTKSRMTRSVVPQGREHDPANKCFDGRGYQSTVAPNEHAKTVRKFYDLFNSSK